MIESHIYNFITDHKLRNKTVIVGFSGGFDSMCLIHALNKISDKLGLNIIAAHFNHNWRGEKSKLEQAYCKEFCDGLGITFFTETAPDDTKKTETIARELRYEFFERVKKEYNTDIVITAHNYNDNAETLIYRIAKGTGLKGLKGIAKVRDNYYRPLLEISRDEIEDYCEKNGLRPNNDESNKNTIYKRNLIRHEVLPLLKKINPNVVGAINNLARVTECELEILDEYIKKIRSEICDNNVILTREFAKLSKNVQQKIIYDYIYDSEADYDYRLIENAVKFLNRSISGGKISKFSLTKDCWLYVDSRVIEIIKRGAKNELELPITGCGEYCLNDKVIEIDDYQIPAQTTDETCVYVDLGTSKNLLLRTRRDGDIIHPLGAQGKMKLKKYLMSKKIPQHKRDDLLLVCDDNEVLWVAGVGLSEKIKTTTVSTHRLKIRENK